MKTNETMIALTDRTDRSSRLFGKYPSTIARQARHALEASSLFRGRSKLIRIDESDGRLMLEGRLPSYYLKQMLQTLLRDVEGVEQVENQVAVEYPTE